jgi:hypothetical protein
MVNYRPLVATNQQPPTAPTNSACVPLDVKVVRGRARPPTLCNDVARLHIRAGSILISQNRYDIDISIRIDNLKMIADIERYRYDFLLSK